MRRPAAPAAACSRQRATAAPASSQHGGAAARRDGGVERHVGAAGLEHGRAAPTSESERALERAGATTRLGPDAQRAQAAGQRGWRGASSSRVGQRARRRATTATASGVARRLRLEQLVQRRVDAEAAPRCRSTRRAAAGARSADSSGSARQRRLGRRPRPPRSRALEVAEHALDRRGVEQVGVVARAQPMQAAAVARRAASGRTSTAVGASTRSGRSGKPRQLERRALGRVLQDEHHLEERAAVEVALRLQLLDQLLERQVLVGVGAERDLAHPRRAARGTSGRPTGRSRSTSVLTKKPISPSISARLRPATGVPTHDVVLAGVAAQQRLEGGQQRHEQRGALAPAERRAALAASVGGEREARTRRRGRSAPAGRGRSVGSSSSAGAPASCRRQ